jgi:gamma-glutamyltranspeptidase/glutathione hydrolase
VVAGSTGVILQNRGAYFSLDRNHPNRLEPGKIPLHTLIASMAKRDGKLWSVLGCMGADGQPQIQLQLYSAMIDFGLDIQEAIEMPRFLSGRFALGDARDTLHIESRFPEARSIRSRGAAIRSTVGRPGTKWPGTRTASRSIRGTALLSGGSDPRSDGAAIGY